jgi:hypothetical protein
MAVRAGEGERMTQEFGGVHVGDPAEAWHFRPMSTRQLDLLRDLNEHAVFHGADVYCCDCPVVVGGPRQVRSPAVDKYGHDPRPFWRGAGGGRGVRSVCCRTPKSQPKSQTRRQRLKRRFLK